MKYKHVLHNIRPRDAARKGIMNEVWGKVLLRADNNALNKLSKKTLFRVARLVEDFIKSQPSSRQLIR